MRSQFAFTLVELLVAVAILGIVLVYVLTGFSAHHQTYVVVDDVAQAQGNARAVASLVERDLRSAGFKIPERMAVCGSDNTNGPDSIAVAGADLLRTVDPTTPMNLVPVDWSAEITNAVGNQITLSTLDIDSDGDNDFSVGGGALFASLDDAGGAVACGSVAGIAGTTLTVNNLVGAIPALGDRRAAPAHFYSVAGTALQRDGIVLADNVEDLQIAYWFDANENDQEDAGEWQGEANQYNPQLNDHMDLRSVRLNIVAITTSQDPRDQYAEGSPQVTENRTYGAGGPPPDGFHRRVYGATVRVRNVGTR